MIPTDDEVRTAEVFANDRMPHRFSGPPHSHRERQEAQKHRVLRIVSQHRMVTTNTCVMIYIARLGHAHHRVDQQVRLKVCRRPKSKLLVRPVHWVPGLKRDDLAPAQLRELPAHFVRSHAGRHKVIVLRWLDRFDGTPNIPWVGLVHQVRHRRMLRIRSSVHLLRFRIQIRLPFV